MPNANLSSTRWHQFLRRLRQATKLLHLRDDHYRLLAETIPQIVWTATPDDGLDYCNHRLFELTGQPAEQSRGNGWHQIIHPDDLPVAVANWEKSRRNSTPIDAEYRLQTRDGNFRWHLVRATPLRDGRGNVMQWFGTCTDIQDQMHAQEALEEQIKQHTAALMEANSRLESEMKERALAQQELDRQNERMVKELTRRSVRATMLAKLAELLQSCAALTDIFSVAAGMAPKIFPNFRGAVLLFNSSRKMLEASARWGDCTLPADLFEAQDCWALRTGHLHYVPAGDSTARCAHVASLDAPYLCVPLLSQGEAIGILHFEFVQPEELSDSEKSFASTFADQIALSVANLRLREALRNQSIRDPLTGLYNRRYLEEMMERETRRAVRAEHGLGVLMLDLDHFKKFNDTYGHDAGDTVLRETTSFLVKSVRAEDIVCRYGGEEFVIILPMADLHASHARAERIRSKIRDLSAMHQGQTMGILTLSIGVAELPDHGTTPKELLAAADAALYRAKREGRDRVVVASAPITSESDPSMEVAASK
jgi:diguanylate cyclase (GGDEF)-like protein/PAS domain S-box-containing protein